MKKTWEEQIKAAEDLMAQPETSTQDVFKDGEVVILAPTTNILNKEGNMHLVKGEYQQMRHYLTSFGQHIFARAGIVYVAIGNSRLVLLKDRYREAGESDINKVLDPSHALNNMILYGTW